ncbi:MAG: hypothetical protein VYA80_05115 [Pseudomonadota bacterium]|nr:hypothetical protein [Pseudomonadota bacterium]
MLKFLQRIPFQNPTGLKTLLTFILAVSSLMFMAFIITPAFQEATSGLSPFDLNFDINAEQIYQDLPFYTDQSRRLYLGFAIVDYIYPALVAIFFSMFWAWIFSKAPNKFFDKLISFGILLFPFLYMLVDWAENTGFLLLIYYYPEEFRGIADVASVLKSFKPKVMNFLFVLTLIFITLGLYKYLKDFRATN